MNRNVVLCYLYKQIVCLCCLIMAISPSILYAQEDVAPKGRLGEFFPYPFSHITFVQPRFDQLNQEDGVYTNTYAVRAAHAFKNAYHVRVDLPFASTNSSGKDVFGLADLALRFLHAFPLSGRLYSGYAMEFTLPTATDKSLGSGKFQVKPGMGLVYFLGSGKDVKGTAALAVNYRFDLFGPSDRPDIDVLEIAPNIDYWANKWYLGYYATWSYDFNSRTWDIPLDIEYGYLIMPKITLSAEYILPLIKKKTYQFEYAFKLKYLF